MTLRKDGNRDVIRLARETASDSIANAALASPYVNALRLGRESSSGNVNVVASVTRFEQPITTTGSEKWRGVVRANGLHFHVPYDAPTVLIHNPDTGRMWQMTAAELGLAASAFSGTQKWNRAVVGRDGKIYCVPFDATSILVIDPVAMTATLETFGLPTSALSGGDKWDGGALGPDGLIYCVPYSAATVLIIDTQNQTARVLTATQLGLSSTAFTTNGTNKYSGAVCVGTKIYGVPFGANLGTANVLVIDTVTLTATQPSYGLATTGAGSLADASKWSGACVVGTAIYCAPFNSTDILVIDTVAATAVRTAMGATLTGNSKFRGLVAVANKLYGIPHLAASFLVIDPLDTTASAQGTATRNNFNGYDIRTPTTTGDFIVNQLKWSGGLAYKGIIYGCPSGTVQAGQDILICNPVAGTAYHTDGRALYNLNIATKWFGGVQHPSGWSVTIPASATDFLLIYDVDPNDDYPVAVRSTLGLTLSSGNQKYQGGALMGDGTIIAFPRSESTQMLKIDLSDKTGSQYGTATLFGGDGAVDLDTGATGLALNSGIVDSQAYHSSVVGMDGKAYAVPYNATKVLIYDYQGTIGSLSRPMLAFTNFGLSTVEFAKASKWVGGCLHPNGKIYFTPRTANLCLIIDTNPASATYGQAWLTNFGVDLDVGSGLTGPANLALKWSYFKLGADGRMYAGPRRAANVLVVDPSDTSVSPFGKATFENFGLDMSGFAAIDGYSIASKMGTDGKLYIACVDGMGPAGTGPFLVIDTITRTAVWEDFDFPTSGTNNINTGNKVAGAIHTLSGAIIFVPRSAQYAIRIRPKCPPLPDAAIFHPSMIAN